MPGGMRSLGYGKREEGKGSRKTTWFAVASTKRDRGGEEEGLRNSAPVPLPPPPLRAVVAPGRARKPMGRGHHGGMGVAAIWRRFRYLGGGLKAWRRSALT